MENIIIVKTKDTKMTITDSKTLYKGMKNVLYGQSCMGVDVSNVKTILMQPNNNFQLLTAAIKNSNFN